MAETKNLYQRLLDITSEVGKIEKTGRNSQQGYAFIEQAKVVAEIRPQLHKHGVMILPETVSRNISQVTNSKGTVFTQVTVASRYTLVNADNPEERMTLEWDAGEALDLSDKATNKATTASQKTFLMKLFNISDQDDPDKDHIELDKVQAAPKPAPKFISADQIKTVIDKLKEKGATTLDEANSMAYVITGLDKISEIKPSDFESILKDIDNLDVNATDNPF